MRWYARYSIHTLLIIVRFREDDNPQQYQDKLQKYYFPYHNLVGNKFKILDCFGRVLFIDGHSYPLTCFPFERFPNDLRPKLTLE